MICGPTGSPIPTLVGGQSPSRPIYRSVEIQDGKPYFFFRRSSSVFPASDAEEGMLRPGGRVPALRPAGKGKRRPRMENGRKTRPKRPLPGEEDRRKARLPASFCRGGNVTSSLDGRAGKGYTFAHALLSPVSRSFRSPLSGGGSRACRAAQNRLSSGMPPRRPSGAGPGA